MHLDSLNLLKLTDKQLIKINSQLPKPRQEIVGHVNVLPVTIAMGCQITVLAHNDWREWLKSDTWFLLDGNKKISFPCFTHNTSDATDDYLKIGGDYFCIGSASLGRKYSNHVDAWYSTQFFGFNESNTLQTDFEKRRGWCCTMSKNNPLRDHIVDIIKSDHIHRFEDSTWFCYDGIKPNHKLIASMFRTPNSDHIPMMEYVDGLENTNAKAWRNLRFENQYSLHRGNEQRPVGRRGTKNALAQNVGYLLGPWHKQCLIELVAESRHDIFEPTEKTVKPLRAGMPFVTVASHKFLYTLRKMGFRTFHPYIDESYDLEPDWRKRTKMAIDSMFNFLSTPKSQRGQIKSICEHNQNIIVKIGMHDPIRRIAKKLKRLVTFD